MRVVALAVALAATAAAPVFAQEAVVTRGASGVAVPDFSTLPEAAIRRLDHYASKVLDEMTALAAAERQRDRRAQDLHADELQIMAERYMGAAFKVGLDADGADAYFRARLAELYTGPLPANLVSENGLPSIQQVLAGEHRGTETETTRTGSYVDAIREVGKETFGD